MKNYKGFFDSTNGSSRVAYYLCVPEGKPKCIIQFAHGMCESGGLYLPFMKYLAERGCVACSMDFIGHAHSAADYAELGFFAEENGHRFLVRDMKRFTDMIKSRFPDIPLIIVGHSMGSFISREYLTWYGEGVDGAVLMGTADGLEGQGLLSFLASLLCLYKNGRYHLKPVMYMGCLWFCGKMGMLSWKWNWLSREPRIRKYMDLRAFGYTAKGYRDIIAMLMDISCPEWAGGLPKKLPILLMSGLSDPVGNCGKGVAKLYRRLKNAGCENVRVRLYNGARHMLLHECNKYQVYDDIYRWIIKITEGKDKNEKAVS